VLPAYGYTDRDGSQEGDQKKTRERRVERSIGVHARVMGVRRIGYVLLKSRL